MRGVSGQFSGRRRDALAAWLGGLSLLLSSLLLLVLGSAGGCGGSTAPPEPSATANGGPASASADSKAAVGEATGIATGQPGQFAFQELENAASGFQWTYRNGEEANQCAILESLGGGVGLFDYDGDRRLDVCVTGGGTLGGGRGNGDGAGDDVAVAGAVGKSGGSGQSGNSGQGGGSVQSGDSGDSAQSSSGSGSGGVVELRSLPTGLFRNRDGQSFESIAGLAGLERAMHYTHGIAAADYDHDGWNDILLTGFGGLQLWRNCGDGTFADATAASGLTTDSLWSSSAAWGDFNGDGALDLYVAHYTDWSPANHPFCPGPQPGVREICGPREFNPLPDSLFLGNGDGTFREATREAGLRPDGKGLGVVAGDVDADGDLDIYVANDTTENFLYINDGRGKFKEIGLLAGVATDDRGVPDGSMGVDIMDFNNDGRADLWAANYEREAFALYRNEDHGQFLHVSQSTGITALGGLFVGFGTAFIDIDLDGDEDALVANGHVIKYPRAAARRQPPLLLENRQGRFHRVLFPAQHYFSTAWESRGLATGDLDGDGRPDVAIAHVNEPSRILLNRSQDVAAPSRWLAVRLSGRDSNRNAIGARLVLHTSAGPQTRLIKGGGSYLSQSDYRVVWGVPAGATVDRLEIDWPSGRRQTVNPALHETRWVVEPPADPPESPP